MPPPCRPFFPCTELLRATPNPLFCRENIILCGDTFTQILYLLTAVRGMTLLTMSAHRKRHRLTPRDRRPKFLGILSGITQG